MTKEPLIFGIILVVFGLIAVVGKIFKIQKMFYKRDMFIRRYGEKWGPVVHTFSYTVVPIVIGTVLILRYYGIVTFF